jgi:hypothetical protein
VKPLAPYTKTSIQGRPEYWEQICYILRLGLSSLINFTIVSHVHALCMLVNPRRACAERVTVVVLCVRLSVSLSVTKLTATYFNGLYVENKVPLGFSWHFQHMHCVDFVENALPGDICWPPLRPSSLLDELSVDETDSDSFISRFVVCRPILAIVLVTQLTHHYSL